MVRGLSRPTQPGYKKEVNGGGVLELPTMSIDLGKTVFHLVGLDLHGGVVVRKKFSRKQLLHFTANLRVKLMRDSVWCMQICTHPLFVTLVFPCIYAHFSAMTCVSPASNAGNATTEPPTAARCCAVETVYENEIGVDVSNFHTFTAVYVPTDCTNPCFDQ
jgi:hypothetical protein